MPFTRQTSFAGGELAPRFQGRSDLPTYATGLRYCQNMYVSRHGTLVSRPGTRHIANTKADGVARLIPFIVADDTSYVLEVGDQYIRFYSNGAQVESSPGTPLEVATPYLAADIWGIRYAQSGDVLTLTHPSYAPRELARYGATTWVLTTVSFARPALTYAVPKLDNATLPVADATHPAREWTWQMTEIRRDARTGVVTESAPATVTLTSTGAAVAARYAVYPDKPVKVTPTLSAGQIAALAADPNFIAFRIYRGRGGLFGWIGDTRTDDFTDVGQEPDYTIPPPQGRNPFAVPVVIPIGGWVRVSGVSNIATTTTPHGLKALDWFTVSPGEANFPAGTYQAGAIIDAYSFNVGAGGGTATSTAAHSFTRTENPTAVGFFQERRVFGATANRPGFVFASATGDYYDFDEALLPVAGQALTFELAARRREDVRHFLAHRKLLVFTNSSVWTFDGAQGPLDGDSVEARVLEEIGIGLLPPLLVDGVALYQRMGGGGVRAITHDESGSMVGTDVSAHAQHLFDKWIVLGTATAGIIDWTYAENPDGIIWATHKSGQMFSLTFQRNGQAAWARHNTFNEATSGYNFQSVCAVPEGVADGVYVVVDRSSAFTGTVRCVERLATRNDNLADRGMAIDAARPFVVGAAGAIASISPFRNGDTVYVWRNTSFEPWGPFTVAAGGIALTQAALGFDPAALNGVTVYVGYPITQHFETLDALPGDVRQRQCVAVGLEVIGNGEVGADGTVRRLLSVGPSLSSLSEWPVAAEDVVRELSLSSQTTSAIRVPLGSGWAPNARVAVRATSKWWTAVSLTREFQAGD